MSRPMLRCGGREFALATRTLVMGIVNVTPDSFSDGGQYVDAGVAVAHGQRLLDEGADVLDVGGESTRPGAAAVSVEEELRRVLPVVEGLVAAGVRCISVDTRNARTAEAGLLAGASWINDVSALRHDPGMSEVALRADAVVLMHAREMTAGRSGDSVRYDDVVAEVKAFLSERARAAMAAGVPLAKLVLDPGIGFGKRVEDNLALTRGIGSLHDIGAAAVLYGASRKRFIGVLAGVDEPARRDPASIGAACFAAARGADIVRVHDVRSTVQALRVVDALARGGPGAPRA